ncbi:MAG: hypothetical protein ACSW76_04345 [Bacteroidaceae bacterium]
MKIHRIRILLSKGWYHVVYAFSFMLFSALCSCSSSRAISKQKTVDANDVEVPNADDVDIPSADEISTIRMEDFESLGIETPDIRLMYGVQIPPSAR